MTVGERESAGRIMIAGRHVHPRGPLRISEHRSVVERVWMFIDKDPGQGRAQPLKVTEFFVRGPLSWKPILGAGGCPFTHVEIHGDATHAFGPPSLPLGLGHGSVSRTLVN